MITELRISEAALLLDVASRHTPSTHAVLSQADNRLVQLSFTYSPNLQWPKREGEREEGRKTLAALI